MRQPRQRRALLTLLVVIAGQVAVSFAFALYFSRRFPPLGRRFPLFHASEVLALMLIMWAVIGSLVRAGRPRTRVWRRAVSGALGAASALLLLLYATDFTSNQLWRENVNGVVVRDYALWALGFGRETRPFSLWVYLAVLGIVVTVSGLFVLLSDALFADVESLVQPDGRHSLFRHPRRTRLSLAGLAVFAALLGVELTLLVRFMANAGTLHRDPIVGFFRPQGHTGRFGWYLGFEEQRRRVAEERASYRQLGQSADRNVIIIVDSLRADHMQLYGYDRPTTPFLSGLERDGRLRKVRTALSMCALSPCGILSTMSGKNVPRLQSDFKIFDLLHDIGYRSYFILSGLHEWEGLHLAYGDEQALYIDGASGGRFSSQDDHTILNSLDRVPANTNDRAFFYIHLMSAHWAGTRWPEFKRFLPSDLHLDINTVLRGGADRQKSVNHYDNGVLQADAVIARVFEKLEALGYLANSTVMILGDHGEALGERGPSSYFHGNSLHQESIHIPLLIYDDTRVEYKNLEFAAQLDVAPTVADRLGVVSPPSWSGRSLLEPANDRAILIGEPGCGAVAFRRGPEVYKYLGCGSGLAELYELNSDSNETRDILGQADPQLVEYLRGTLNEKKDGGQSAPGRLE